MLSSSTAHVMSQRLVIVWIPSKRGKIIIIFNSALLKPRHGSSPLTFYQTTLELHCPVEHQKPLLFYYYNAPFSQAQHYNLFCPFLQQNYKKWFKLISAWLHIEKKKKRTQNQSLFTKNWNWEYNQNCLQMSLNRINKWWQHLLFSSLCACLGIASLKTPNSNHKHRQQVEVPLLEGYLLRNHCMLIGRAWK